MRVKIALVLAAATVLVLGVKLTHRLLGQPSGGSGSQSYAVAQEAPSLAVGVVPVKMMSVPERQAFTGTVSPSLSADISAKIMGKVVSVYVREGGRVRAGQVLVQLDNSDLLSQVQQAEAAVVATRAALVQAQIALDIQRTQSQTRIEQARAELNQALEQLSIVKEGALRQEKAQADENVHQARAAYERAKEAVQMAKAELQQSSEGVKQAEAALEAARQQLAMMKEGFRRQQRAQAEANLKVAQATYERFKPLAEQGVISQQRFDEIVLQLESAKAQYESAKAQVSLMQEGFRPQEVRQAEESVRQAEAALNMAKELVRLAEAAYQERLAALQQAEAALRAAEHQRDLVYEGARKQEIRQSEERVKQARKGLRMALAAAKEWTLKPNRFGCCKRSLDKHLLL